MHIYELISRHINTQIIEIYNYTLHKIYTYISTYTYKINNIIDVRCKSTNLMDDVTNVKVRDTVK